MQPTITLPRGWGIPRFALGQRTKHGKIIGIECCNGSWNYALEINDYELEYILENQIQPLSHQELETEILAEIDEHLMQVAILQEELGADLEIRTQFAKVNRRITKTATTNRSTSRLTAVQREKVA
ncbi:hypothetical protein [aff. Roholtiella sp. LEGE 12411]|uniref:hypothetical protein n=1 Tax=aff. Roholtiella sp. LEGE 12411 TaxID=1828822 RepID=UPI00187FCFAD|nr:hypothetical protein [aff. Roholtiella sp. LEGE 12411]MBE9036043.1 hypothetical protein [aff. Roholtiella sp. LEGE 12411]